MKTNIDAGTELSRDQGEKLAKLAGMRKLNGPVIIATGPFALNPPQPGRRWTRRQSVNFGVVVGEAWLANWTQGHKDQ